MSSIFPILLAGFVAGSVHVVTGPDHLVAVAPLALNQGRQSWLLGIRWGLGHASGVITVAVAAWLLRELLPIESFSAGCERLVGVMLIGIGLWGLRKALKFKLHVHEHTHLNDTHQHLHLHRAHSNHARSHVHTHAAFGVGIMHGLAGGSHFLGVLPALAMPTQLAAGIYLLSFGAGTVLAMTGFSIVFGMIGSKLTSSGAKYFKGAMATCASTAIAVGGYWVIS